MNRIRFENLLKLNVEYTQEVLLGEEELRKLPVLGAAAEFDLLAARLAAAQAGGAVAARRPDDPAHDPVAHLPLLHARSCLEHLANTCSPSIIHDQRYHFSTVKSL
jgi:hypothetical protein